MVVITNSGRIKFAHNKKKGCNGFSDILLLLICNRTKNNYELSSKNDEKEVCEMAQQEKNRTVRKRK